MSIRTIRFNKQEETIVKKLLSFYEIDFSTCVKEMLWDKLEGLCDVGCIKRTKESRSKEEYYSAHEIDKLYKVK